MAGGNVGKVTGSSELETPTPIDEMLVDGGQTSLDGTVEGTMDSFFECAPNQSCWRGTPAWMWVTGGVAAAGTVYGVYRGVRWVQYFTPMVRAWRLEHEAKVKRGLNKEQFALYLRAWKNIQIAHKRAGSKNTEIQTEKRAIAEKLVLSYEKAYAGHSETIPDNERLEWLEQVGRAYIEVDRGYREVPHSEPAPVSNPREKGIRLLTNVASQYFESYRQQVLDLDLPVNKNLSRLAERVFELYTLIDSPRSFEVLSRRYTLESHHLNDAGKQKLKKTLTAEARALWQKMLPHYVNHSQYQELADAVSYFSDLLDPSPKLYFEFKTSFTDQERTHIQEARGILITALSHMPESGAEAERTRLRTRLIALGGVAARAETRKVKVQSINIPGATSTQDADAVELKLIKAKCRELVESFQTEQSPSKKAEIFDDLIRGLQAIEWLQNNPVPPASEVIRRVSQMEGELPPALATLKDHAREELEKIESRKGGREREEKERKEKGSHR